MQQGSKEWLESRKNYLGASDAPVVMGVSPYRTRLQLWREKLGLGDEQKVNQSMRRGKDLEPVAMKAYEKESGNIMSVDGADTIVYHPTYKFMRASLDGLSIDKSIAVELKCPGEEDHEIAKSGKIPEHYYPQVQQELECLNHNALHYFSYYVARNEFGDVKYVDTALVEVKETKSILIN